MKSVAKESVPGDCFPKIKQITVPQKLKKNRARRFARRIFYCLVTRKISNWRRSPQGVCAHQSDMSSISISGKTRTREYRT